MTTTLARKLEILTKKDAEKTGIVEQIEKLEALSLTHCGKLQFSVYQIDGIEESMGGKNVLVDYELSPIDLYESEETMTSKTIGDITNILVAAKAIKIVITLRPKDKSPDDPDSWKFTTTQLVSDIPTDTEFRVELIGRHIAVDLQADSSKFANMKLKIHFKATYDKIGSLLESKKLELGEVEKELKEIGEQIKEAKKTVKEDITAPQSSIKSGYSNGKKKGGKKNKKVSIGGAESQEWSPASSDYLPSLQTMTDALGTTQKYAIEYRSFLLFGISAVLIYFRGNDLSA